MGSQAIEGIPSGPRSRTTGLHDQQSFRVRVQNVFNVAVPGPRQAALARNMSSLNSHTVVYKQERSHPQAGWAAHGYGGCQSHTQHPAGTGSAKWKWLCPSSPVTSRHALGCGAHTVLCHPHRAGVTQVTGLLFGAVRPCACSQMIRAQEGEKGMCERQGIPVAPGEGRCRVKGKGQSVPKTTAHMDE